MTQNFGLNAELNKRMAAGLGYTGDFADGQFQQFLGQNPHLQSQAALIQQNYNDPSQNFGINQNTNRTLSEQTGYTGDFGGGEYQAWVKQQNPETLGTSRVLEQLYTDPGSIFGTGQGAYQQGYQTAENFYGFDQLGLGLSNFGQQLGLGLSNLGQGLAGQQGSGMPQNLTLDVTGGLGYNPVYGGTGYNYGGQAPTMEGRMNGSIGDVWQASGGVYTPNREQVKATDPFNTGTY